MTEAEWLTAVNPGAMLGSIVPRSSPRKLRLASCAFVRQIWPRLADGRSRNAVVAAERYADEPVRSKHAERQLDRVRAIGMRAARVMGTSRGPLFRDAAEAAAGTAMADKSLSLGVYWLCRRSLDVVRDNGGYQDWNPQFWCDLIRCVFGNPFRPAALSPTWLTPTVTTLARQMYDGRDFGPMPILADALQDAGCDHGAVLDHCRGPGPHARGCWVVDRVLGKP